MGLFDGIKARRKQGVMERFLTPIFRKPPDRNAKEWLQAQIDSPRLAPVNKIATDLAAVPGKLYRYKKDGDPEEIKDHPFLDFMAKPNPLPQISRSAFWKLMEIYITLKGDAAAVIERGRSGVPVELWPIPPHWILLTPCNGHPYYAIQGANQEIKQIPISDIFIMRDLNPIDPYSGGKGMAEAIGHEVETDAFMMQYIKAFFYNNATPPVILSAPEMNEAEYKRFKSAWEEEYGGVRNAHKLGIITRTVNAIRLSENHKEMDFTQSRKDIRDACIAHFGIPPEVMGVNENSNRATITQAKIIYAENVLTPRLFTRQDSVNTQLLAYWDDDLFYKYDDIIPQDEEFRLQKTNEGLSRGAVMIDEWREANGLDTLPDGRGQVLLLPVSSIPIGKTEDLTSSMRQNEQFPLYDPYSGKSVKSRHPKRAAVRRQSERLLQGLELSVQRQIERYFAQQLNLIITAMRSGHKAEDKDWLTELIEQTPGNQDQDAARGMIEQALDGLIDWIGQRAKLEQIMRPMWKNAFDTGAQATQNMGIHAVQAPALTDALIRRGLSRLDEIEETTKRELARSLADGIAAGEGSGQLAARVQEHMPHLQEGRARVIATTEAHTSMMAGNVEQMRAAGMRTKVWVTAGDGDVRDSHTLLNGDRVPIDEPFSNGLMYPGDPSGPPGEIINCRCTIMAGDLDDL